jgi:uncharacterized protein
MSVTLHKQLISACSEKDNQLVESLVARNAPVRLTEQSSALHVAASCDNSVAIELIAKYSPNEVRQCDHLGRTPLITATLNRHHNAIVTLLRLDADIDAVDETRSTPLIRAAENGFVDIVQLLLDYGANTAKRNVCFIATYNSGGGVTLCIASL